jgi:hypothetical protein
MNEGRRLFDDSHNGLWRCIVKLLGRVGVDY